MRSASRLLRFGSPSHLGLIAISHWRDIESHCGALPVDYKDLISTFGYGSFGDFALFHPEARRSRSNLMQGEKEAREMIAAERSDVLDTFLRGGARILGIGPERRYWAYDGHGWFSIAWDVEEIESVGNDLCEFIHAAYESLSSGRPRHLAEAIWKSSLDGSRDRFFTPARSLE